MSRKRRGDWKPPRDRREVAVAVLSCLAVLVVTATLVWFLRPNRDSGSSTPNVTTPTTVSTGSTAAGSTTAPSGTPTTGAPTTLPPTTSRP
jgi:hypothetical protein